MQALQLPATDIASAVKPPKNPVTDEQRAKIHAAAIDFESVFLNEMLKPMFESVDSDDPAFGGSREEGIYQSMMVEKVGSSLAKSGGIGIAKHIEKELLRLQETA